jgi:integrase
MPRPSKGPYLYLFEAKGRATVWYIRDGQRSRSTGCLESESAEAQRKLAAYILEKHDPRAGQRGSDPNAVKVADALSVYMDDKIAAGVPRPKALIAMVEKLGEFFGERTVADLKGSIQRDYARQRGSLSSARRELETMAAAINYFIKEMVGGAQMKFRPVLPDASPARERWLTRDEAARLIWAAWRKREDRGGHGEAGHNSGGRYTSRHIARFILVALYTGSRAGAICGAALIETIGRGLVDLESGQFRRLAYGKVQNNKRQPTVELPPRLLAHMRRWHRLGVSKRSVVEYNGKPVLRVSKGWPGVVEEAKLATEIKERKVLPHTLRHTAISWYLRSGVPVDQVADYCGVSIPIIKAHYGHHIPGREDGIIRASNRIGRSATVSQQKQVNRA